jgi:HSP20 family protein
MKEDKKDSIKTNLEKEESEDWETENIEEEKNNDNKEEAPVEITFQKERSWIKKDGELAVDVYETENSIIIQAPLAGVKKEEIEVVTEKDMIIIKGKRERCEEKEIKGFYTQECFFGSFRREIILPEEVDLSHIDANIDEGILKIEVPKIEREKSKKIKI